MVRIDVDNFNLISSYDCIKNGTVVYTDTTHTSVVTTGWSNSTNTPSTATKYVQFELNLPESLTVAKATVHARLGSSAYGAESVTINGVSVSEGKECEVDVTAKVREAVEAREASVSVPFSFKSYAVEHNHAPTEMTQTNSYWNTGKTTQFTTYKKTHSGSLAFKDVYLLIETSAGGTIYRVEGGELVPYRLCRAEGGELVPYQLCRAEGGKLVPYS